MLFTTTNSPKAKHIHLWIVLFFSFSPYQLTFSQEHQPMPDKGNGLYQNPIIPGRFADPTVCKVGEDYYMTHSMGGTPNLLIWHSRDLVNWHPLTYANTKDYGIPWAPDLVYVNGLYYIYVTFVGDKITGNQSFENVVLVAKDPKGPWSEPINLHIKSLIDPGHIIDTLGNRYLYFNGGKVVTLDKSGTKVTSSISKVYDGWAYPNSWITECFCLESPKINYKDGWYYLTSAQGGTTGPSTSHMAIVARSKSILGPWENSPYNPLIKTKSRNERWWSTGHATLVEGPNTTWYAVFHGYENNYRPLGRQTLMLPISWSDDGWPINLSDQSSDGFYEFTPKPNWHSKVMTLSDSFNTHIGMQWRILEGTNAFAISNQKLKVEAKGTTIESAAKMACMPLNHSYEVTVQVDLRHGSEGGMLLYVNPNMKAGFGIRNDTVVVWSPSKARHNILVKSKNITLKLRNIRNDIALFYKEDGESIWEKIDLGMEISAFNSSPITLYALGEGNISFDNFTYLGLE